MAAFAADPNSAPSFRVTWRELEYAPALAIILWTNVNNQTEKLKIENDVPLAPFTTLGIGGRASRFVRAVSEEHIAAAVKYASENGFPLFILGGGSNIVVSDEGFEGLVLQIGLKGIEFDRDVGGRVLARVAAGEDWDGFVAVCVEQGLAGIECLSGIPGFVGGTPVQNVGAYGQEVSEAIRFVRCFDRKELKFVELSKAECGFEYRKSIFNSTMRDRYIVTAVEFELEKGGEPRVAYKDLAERFAGRTPELEELRNAVIEIRRNKSMVIDPDDSNSRSAGSFFKNPLVPKNAIEEIAGRLGIEKVPHFRVDDETVKIPAAWLIEQAGFRKGFRMGNAGISKKHSLAIVNCGGATAKEVISLSDEIRRVVLEKFDVELQTEPVFVGSF